MTSPPTLNPTVEAFWGFEVRGVAKLQMRSAWITWSPNNQQLVNLKHISIYIYIHIYICIFCNYNIRAYSFERRGLLGCG